MTGRFFLNKKTVEQQSIHTISKRYFVQQVIIFVGANIREKNKLHK